MSQIMKSSLALALLMSLSLLSLSGCGEKNSQADLNPATGKHSDTWLQIDHKTEAKADQESCFGCHGENLDVGISKISCSTCHLGGTGSVHPLQWGQFAYARHAAFVNSNGTATCATASCHGPTLAGVGNIPGCATACHIGGQSAIHPEDWTVVAGQTLQFPSRHADYVTANGYDAASCSNARCHGTDFKGVFLSGPTCFQCHPADPTDPAPLPDKHPRRFAAVWIADQANAGFHGNYLQSALNLDTSSCLTSICHGAGGTGPSCSTPSFNGIQCH